MALGQAIKRLGVVGSVLHTGAHPDDEDSGLLAYLARGRQVRTAYLSLTRGDGGQNVIGPELYEAARGDKNRRAACCSKARRRTAVLYSSV